MRKHNFTLLFIGSILGAALFFIGAYPLKPYIIYTIGTFVPLGKCLNKSFFLSCSNVRQQIDETRFYNIKNERTPIPGWQLYTTVDPNKNSYIIVKLHRDRDKVIFYPRVNAKNGRVVVYLQDGYYKRKLFDSGPYVSENRWSDISMQYDLDLSSVSGESQDKETDINLVVVLTGSWAQLWHKGNAIFF
ncbi:hypothetical protein [Solidesulfovibrio sp. C21]|uniref:hypothetical protein n=1 Tax=Solidesulfovibrio sp. C21 TaxID=3398613 RepID=UPI0039FC8621